MYVHAESKTLRTQKKNILWVDMDSRRERMVGANIETKRKGWLKKFNRNRKIKGKKIVAVMLYVGSRVDN